MKFKDVKARCLYCEATVEGNQGGMAGRWESPDDLTPEWKFNKEAGRRWLWYRVGSPVVHQDFYLCPEHNDPDHFHSAMNWANARFERQEFIDFTHLQALPPPLAVVERWKEPSLDEQIPDPGGVKYHEKLPNTWQVDDIRLNGCLEISWAITDIIDANSGLVLDQLESPTLPKPLELAEAMKKAAKNIELLTKLENLADGGELNQAT